MFGSGVQMFGDETEEGDAGRIYGCLGSSALQPGWGQHPRLSVFLWEESGSIQNSGFTLFAALLIQRIFSRCFCACLRCDVKSICKYVFLEERELYPATVSLLINVAFSGFAFNGSFLSMF